MRSARVACVAALCAAASLGAQERPAFWSFLKSGQVVTRCVESSPAHLRAVASLNRLDEHLEALKDTDPTDKVEQELRTLLGSECFRLAFEAGRIPQPDSAESLTGWWLGGGRAWLESYLELPRLGPVENRVPNVVVPPDARKTLQLEAHRDHPLQGLLCLTGDAECGVATRGWKLRADSYFEAHRALGRREGPSRLDGGSTSGPRLTSRDCAEKASTVDAGQRYEVWRTCVDSRRPKRVALPLGEFKAPAAGWLVITGRRGHYEFCDTTRAYDLSTGTAFVSDSCSDLALRNDGSVDRGATNRARVEHVRVGTLSAENIKEALWMMLLRAEAQEVQLKAEYYPLPAGLVPRVTVRPDGEFTTSGLWANTAQTTLTWQWLPPAGPAFAGRLTWPDSYDAAEDHAASLLDIAERSLVERCAPASVPAAGLFTSRGTRRLNSVSAKSVEELHRELAKASDKWGTPIACRSDTR
jgi:hypothetical protein